MKKTFPKDSNSIVVLIRDLLFTLCVGLAVISFAPRAGFAKHVVIGRNHPVVREIAAVSGANNSFRCDQNGPLPGDRSPTRIGISG
jgi:hypothetical protein